MDNSIRICTYNIRLKCKSDTENGHGWTVRVALIGKKLSEIDPDIVCMQEVRYEQMSDLKELLSKYDYEYLPRDGKEDEGAPIFYKKERFELIQKDSFYLNEHPETPGKGWDALCLRVSSYVVLKDKETGKVIKCFNTHLDHVGEIARQEGVKFMVKTMKESGGTQILAGDFNVFEHTPTYDVAASMLLDSKYLAAETMGGNTFHQYGEIPYDKANQPIDYIFVSNDVKVKSYTIDPNQVDGQWPSDHFPVYADCVIE